MKEWDQTNWSFEEKKTAYISQSKKYSKHIPKIWTGSNKDDMECINIEIKKKAWNAKSKKKGTQGCNQTNKMKMKKKKASETKHEQKQNWILVIVVDWF